MLLLSVSVSGLVGCATIVNGPNQTIKVLTPPVNDAQCAVENDKGKWLIDKTPDTVVVKRSAKNLLVTCKKAQLSKQSISITPELSKVTYLNILFGGFLGGVVDRANGSAYEYPSEITVPLAGVKR